MAFDPAVFNDQNYATLWASLNEKVTSVRQEHGLGAAFEALHAQQLHLGFVQDDLGSVQRCRIPEPKEKLPPFIVQYNPRRADRGAGFGRKYPPPKTASVNGGCFLCKPNVRWQQRSIEIGYDLEINDTKYVTWVNPFPLMPVHVTIAKLAHEPQTWLRDSVEESHAEVRRIVTELLDIAHQLPDFIGFYNGEGAGASIPGHFHFQFFKRPEGQKQFPIEAVAEKDHAKPPCHLQEYPITTLYFHGPAGAVANQATDWVSTWTDFYNNDPALSANIIVTRDESDSDQFHLYFVPRNKAFSNAPGMVGRVAGLEVLGELVFTTQVEKEALDTGRVNHAYVRSVLSAVEAPGVREFLRTLNVRTTS